MRWFLACTSVLMACATTQTRAPREAAQPSAVTQPEVQADAVESAPGVADEAHALGERAELPIDSTQQESPHALIEQPGLPVSAVCDALRAQHADPVLGFWHALPVLRHGSLLELEGCGPNAKSAIEDVLPRLGSHQFKQVDCGGGVRALWILGRVDQAEAFEAAVAETSCHVRARQDFSPEHGALRLRQVLGSDAALAPQLRVTCQYVAVTAKYLRQCLERVPESMQALRDDVRDAYE